MDSEHQSHDPEDFRRYYAAVRHRVRHCGLPGPGRHPAGRPARPPDQEILVIVLAYGVALLAIICGILCLKNVATGAMTLDRVLALLGLAGVIYNQIALDSFNLFDMLGLLFGVSIAATAMKLKK